MRFGLQLMSNHDPNQSPQENFREKIEHVRAARRAGFDLVNAGDHFLNRTFQLFKPVPTLGRLAAESGDMYVGAAFLAAFHHPITVAEQFATLDAITDGKVLLSPVAGYRDVEFEAYGVPKRKRWMWMRECVEAVKLLWTEDGVTYEGDYFAFEEATITFKPVQEPRPPIWIGANSDEAAKHASRVADAYLGNAQCDEETLSRQIDTAETPSGEGLRGLQPARRDVFVAETDEEAIETIVPPLREFYEWYEREGMGDAAASEDGVEGSIEERIEDQFIIGSPETVADRLVTLHDDVGVDLALLGMHRPGVPLEAVVNSIELTGSEVMPRVEERIRR